MLIQHVDFTLLPLINQHQAGA